ncbi:MAG TPA: Trp biosynthesis-associated membrane protein [Actinoplanes sp.]|nr:Trp biosynthesis-associated membrane protein [Actinoplanes sp.]
MSRRSYLLSLLACLAGAGLAAYAATRTWSLEVTPRPGLSDLRTVRTGADVEPFLIGLALVALAGTGALLATHGRLRRVLGGLLTLVGAGVTVGAIVGRAGLATGEAGSGGMLWPVICALSGAIIAVGGLVAARHGHQWPRMSARYERKPAPAAATAGQNATGQNNKPVDNRAAWDSLDRGNDPTA